MKAGGRSPFRTVTAALSHSLQDGFSNTARSQHISAAWKAPQVRCISCTSARSTSVALGLSTSRDTHQEQPQSAGHEAVSQHEHTRPLSREAFLTVPLEHNMRLFAPPDYAGNFRDAKNLDEALAGAADWIPKKLSVMASRPDELRSVLEEWLSDRSISVERWLAFRNTMLCKSWPDARRHMVSVSDAEWPAHALQHAMQTVVTPSEISDALALLLSNIKRFARLTHPKREASFKCLQHCFLSLMTTSLQGKQGALHLIPRLVDALVLLVEIFPRQVAAQEDFIEAFVRQCATVADDRAREAVINVLDSLRSDGDEDVLADKHHQVVALCIEAIEASMKGSKGETAASEQFADVTLIEHLLQQDFPKSSLKKRALRCAVYVAGRGLDYTRIWRYFDQYQEIKRERGMVMTGPDYILLAKALVHTRQGRNGDAMHALQRAEHLLNAEQEQYPHKASSKEKAKQLQTTCMDFVEVMAKSADARLETVLAFLGIFIRNGLEGEAVPPSSNQEQPRAIKRLRADVYAYTMVMHGCLVHKRPRVAITVWQAMLHRGVLPTTACLSVLLQNLFSLRDAGGALRQLHHWCEKGVLKPAATSDKWQEIILDQLETQEYTGTLSTPGSDSTAGGAERYKLKPDPILANVVFSGLHSCGSNGVEALWTAYQQTIHFFPDAPVLALLLKVSCENDETSSMAARFGRQVFRNLLFGKHAELAEYRNPLREELEAHGTAGWIFSDDTVGSRMEKWFSTIFQAEEIDLSAVPNDLSGLVFTRKVFEHYVRLLLSLQHSSGLLMDARLLREELVDVLGWMKELDLKPSKTHLALTLLEIEEHLPPPVAARQMEVLEAWLKDWIGSERLPSEEEMQVYWRWKMEHNGRSRGWFDRVSFSRLSATKGSPTTQPK